MDPVAMLQCVQCARTAEALGAARLLVLWQGMWILLIPPVALLSGILWLAWRRSRQAEVGMAMAGVNERGADSRPAERR
jgi:hypothetical protein